MAVLKFTSDNFDSEVLQSDKPVLVDLWATWCAPCRMQGPIVEKLADELTDVKIGKLDVDENSDIAEKYNVMSIPTLLVFKNGEVVQKAVGVHTREQLIDMINSAR
jgi:thioredoxin 1